MKNEFEMISAKKTEKVDDFSNLFAHVVTNLRNSGENPDKYDAILRLLWSIPKKYNALIPLLEQTSDLKRYLSN